MICGSLALAAGCAKAQTLGQCLQAESACIPIMRMSLPIASGICEASLFVMTQHFRGDCCARADRVPL